MSFKNVDENKNRHKEKYNIYRKVEILNSGDFQSGGTSS